MTTTTYAVTGMTCGHCVSAVTSELTALAGEVCRASQARGLLLSKPPFSGAVRKTPYLAIPAHTMGSSATARTHQ